MSTESETKSAGVPAGATQQCAACGQYWNDADWPIPPFTDLKCRCDDVRPIAEAGPAPTTAETPALPQARACIHGAWNCQACLWANGRPAGELTAHYLAAPTTAAPAELPNRREFHASTPAEFAAAATVAQGGDTIIVPDWPLPREAAPAEQPGKADEGDHADDCTDPNCHKRHTIPAGKAADPRPAQPQAPVQTYQADAPEHLTISSAFGSVQPQAPAEPSKEQFDKAGRVLAAVMDAERRGENMDPIIARALAAEAATLREERDRLASQLVGMTGERDDERKISPEWEEKAEAAEKAVAERDTRIATLEQASWSFAEWAERAQCFGCDVEFSEDPEPDDTQPCECCESIRRSYRLVIAAIGRERVQSLRGRAALGAPEGQPRNDEVQTDPTITPKQAQRESDEATAAAYADEMRGEPCPVAPEGEPPAAPSAPPRKAPQEGCKACALVAKEFGTDKCPWCGRPFGTTVGYVEKCSAMHHAVRSAMGLDKPAYDARPSSPEEQLSGKELK